MPQEGGLYKEKKKNKRDKEPWGREPYENDPAIGMHSKRVGHKVAEGNNATTPAVNRLRESKTLVQEKKGRVLL